MAYVQPTVSNFKARFPEFAAVDDVFIQLWLDDAYSRFGSTWYERDRALAQMLWVAHILGVEGYGAGGGGSSAGGAATTGAIKRRKVGDVEVEFAGMQSSGGGAGGANEFLASTQYGRMLALLTRLNFPAVAVV